MYIHVKVKTGQKTESIEKKSDDHLEVKVRVEAERNLANTRVLELVAEYLKVPKSHVRIVNGHHSPSKLLSVKD